MAYVPFKYRDASSSERLWLEHLEKGLIDANEEALEPVGTDRIEDGAVTTDKLADQSVSTGKIANDAVTNAKLSPSAVNTLQIADDAVTSAKLAAGSVTSSKLSNGAINNAQIGDGAVTNVKVAAGIDDAKIDVEDFAGGGISAGTLDTVINGIGTRITTLEGAPAPIHVTAIDLTVDTNGAVTGGTATMSDSSTFAITVTTA
ncbi:hypothetical protein F0A16_02750 [Salinicola corii]|uniref:Uncharacterized protein n=1 Tax=Salinicola corii TaxID=2606937 RepID=A0A640WJH1_9GAMM|nr:hypothetical protein [Salinicola corii]KAA0020725.1 hypothetical protein F0A16_02750 [Salinicola corii]